jgi:2-oxoglutarate ferredoxin oxidoreductase subunit alpha
MQRLLRKLDTAKRHVPAPAIARAARPTRAAAVWYGSTGAAMDEALAVLEAQGIHLDRMRIRAFPFADEVADFIASHDQVFVVEQNRDAQLKMLLVNECGIDPARLTSILHYDGTPITARFIVREIAEGSKVLNLQTVGRRRSGLSNQSAE